MKTRYVVNFSRTGEIALVDQNRQLIGVGISFLIHAACLSCIIFAGSTLSNIKPPMVIDFSIEQISGDTTPRKPAAPKTVYREIRPEQPVNTVPAPKIPRPRIATKKIVPVETKKKITQEQEPEQIITEQPPSRIEKVLEEPEPVHENVISDIAEDTFSETAPVAEEYSDDKLSQAAGPVADKTPPPPQEQYIKEHFLYIKDSVQNKISYPRIARKMGWQGKVLISFVVCRDGSVKNIRIVESSGFKALDNNAVEVIQKVAPFPHPPVSAELIIPVIYKLS